MTEKTVEQSVRRIEELIEALDALADPAAREPARALLDAVLELHALALARMTATIASAGAWSGDEPALLRRLAEDEAVRAIMLLHGLHPETVAERVGKAVDTLRPQCLARGLGLKLVHCDAALARVRLRWISEGISEVPLRNDLAVLRREIEAAIVETAPDLETLEIEGLDEMGSALTG